MAGQQAASKPSVNNATLFIVLISPVRHPLGHDSRIESLRRENRSLSPRNSVRDVDSPCAKGTRRPSSTIGTQARAIPIRLRCICRRHRVATRLRIPCKLVHFAEAKKHYAASAAKGTTKMTRLLACLTLALLVSATTLHAQQRPPRTPAEERADRKCNDLCTRSAEPHCSAHLSECEKKLDSCLRQCFEREGVSGR